jgi:hypothetical protein
MPRETGCTPKIRASRSRSLCVYTCSACATPSLASTEQLVIFTMEALRERGKLKGKNGSERSKRAEVARSWPHAREG